MSAHEQIADVEAKLEEPAEAAGRCGKVEIAAKWMIIIGSVLLPLTVLFRLAPLNFVVGVAAVLGGLALLGSNQRTRDEIVASIRAHEKRRTEMIDALKLRSVDEG
jgi:hypothetical protein